MNHDEIDCNSYEVKKDERLDYVKNLRMTLSVLLLVTPDIVKLWKK